jgi:SAM-dependent methyltransferase
VTTISPRFQPELSGQDKRPTRCPACGYDGPEASYPSAEPAHEILTCPDCGFGRTWPPVPQDEIGRWYPEQYYGKENVRFNPVFERMIRWFRKRRAQVLYNRVPRGPVLDVGCGRGMMLSYMRELGYEAHGLELSETAAHHARKILKLEVAAGDFLTSPHEKNRYNAVIFCHTLEHFANPTASIARAYELLKPGGVLWIAVPNFGSWQARLFGRYWFHVDAPRHYFHFTVKSLDAIVQLDHFSFEQNPYGLLQSILNALGFRFNLLYSLLKNSTARTDTALRYPFQTAAHVIAVPLLAPFVAVATLLETAFKSGGTFEMYAFKE